MSSIPDFAAARAAGVLRVRQIEATSLLRLTRFPESEPYWSKAALGRFDDNRCEFGVTYAASDLRVAFAETILHHGGAFIEGRWVTHPEKVIERYIVSFIRPAAPELLLADLTGTGLKALGMNNDLSSSDDYRPSMAISRALHEQLPDLDGILYVSRQMNTGIAAALFERSSILVQDAVLPLADHPSFDQLLDVFNVHILPAGAAP